MNLLHDVNTPSCSLLCHRALQTLSSPSNHPSLLRGDHLHRQICSGLTAAAGYGQGPQSGYSAQPQAGQKSTYSPMHNAGEFWGSYVNACWILFSGWHLCTAAAHAS